MKDRKFRRPVAIFVLVIALLVGPVGTLAYDYLPIDDEAFWWTWARTDYPVSTGAVNRTWMWGPGAYSTGGWEVYLDSPGEERYVQYFDKSRMEINNPYGDPNSPWFVTNGLLAWELMTGNIQVGDNDYWDSYPAEIQVAGDGGEDAYESPWYEDFGYLMYVSEYQVGDIVDLGLFTPWEYQDRAEASDDVTFDEAWFIVDWDDWYWDYGVYAEHYEPATGMTVASVFWEFMNSTGTVYDQYGYYHDYIFENPYYATGLPLTEPYWVYVPVGGVWTDVLVQCFERRCLSYTPDNPPGWQVEAGNIGQHYFEWRYGD